ncbi:MAG: cytochrome c3 family protein [Bacteroidota bacterium]
MALVNNNVLAMVLCGALAIPTVRAAAQVQDQCFVCHSTLEDKASVAFQGDIHSRKGLTCASCHGGDSHTDDMEKAMGTAAGFIGVPKGNAVSEVCAGCHSSSEKMKGYRSNVPVSQWELLKASVHGKVSTAGGEQILQCTTCHNAHGIVPVADPRSPVHQRNAVKTCGTCHGSASYMRRYNPSLPVDQVEKYRTSVHGVLNARGDAKVAECASCHGSHDIRSASDVRSKVHPLNLPMTCAGCHSDVARMKEYKIPTDQYEKFAESVHGKALLEKRDLGSPACNDCHGNHGAVPPGVQSISNVCGTCHALNAELFTSSPHKKAFDVAKLPECETCHGNHEIIATTDNLLGVSPEAVCSNCHSPETNVKGYGVARTMRALIDSLEALEGTAAGLVSEAEQKGMEVGEAKFKLRDARQARLQSRTMVHAFDEAKFEEVVRPGMAIATVVMGEAQAALDDYVFRRVGLGLATLVITLLTLSLYLYIKRIERSPR